MTAAQQAVREAEQALARARDRLRSERARRHIRCACGAPQAVRDFHLIVTHYYIGAHGCTGGDYWSEGEWNIVGPCGQNNRLLFDDYGVDWRRKHDVGVGVEATFKHLYRELFRSTEQEHRGSNPRPNNICDYVDRNRARFELPEKPKREES